MVKDACFSKVSLCALISHYKKFFLPSKVLKIIFQNKFILLFYKTALACINCNFDTFKMLIFTGNEWVSPDYLLCFKFDFTV